MKLVTIVDGDTTRVGRVEGDTVVLGEQHDVGDALASPAGMRDTGRSVPLDSAVLAPLVAAPSKIICVGLNYASHIREMGRELPEHPTLFAKFAESLIAPGADIQLPAESEKMDWEAELGIVIGTTVRRANADEALAAIGGYTVVNDITARDWQYRTLQWLQGKTWESTTPVGPVMVTPEEVDHAADLELVCEVDGTVRQRARTSDLVFGPAALVSYISTIITLNPGDLIATGTPGGVAAAAESPDFLAAGRVVCTSIEGIGALENRCVEAS